MLVLQLMMQRTGYIFKFTFQRPILIEEVVDKETAILQLILPYVTASLDKYGIFVDGRGRGDGDGINCRSVGRAEPAHQRTRGRRGSGAAAMAASEWLPGWPLCKTVSAVESSSACTKRAEDFMRQVDSGGGDYSCNLRRPLTDFPKGFFNHDST